MCMERVCALADLKPGQWGYVTQVEAEPAMGRRLWDLGLIPGTQVTCQGYSPAGDPGAYGFSGAVIALRRCDAKGVTLREGDGIWD